MHGIGIEHLVVDLRNRHLLRHPVLGVLPSHEWIQGYFKWLVKDLSDKPLQKRTWGSIQARVGVDLNQVHSHTLVDHEVVPKDLKLVFYFVFVPLKWALVLGRDSEPKGLQSFFDSIPHLRQYNIFKIYILLAFKINGKVFKWYFVTLLVFTVLFAVALDGIVCQMHVSVGEICDIVSVRGRANVALLVVVPSKVNSIYYLRQSKYSNVKLPHWGVVPVVASYQQRVIDIFLNYPSLIYLMVLQKSPYRIQVRQHHDAFAPVGVLSGLTNPNLLVCVV